MPMASHAPRKAFVEVRHECSSVELTADVVCVDIRTGDDCGGDDHAAGVGWVLGILGRGWVRFQPATLVVARGGAVI